MEETAECDCFTLLCERRVSSEGFIDPMLSGYREVILSYPPLSEASSE